MTQSKTRFGFYTSNQATRLRKFLHSDYRGNANLTVVVHDGKPCDELERLCRKQGIRFLDVDYEQLGLAGRERNTYVSDILLEELRNCQADYCFSFGSRLLLGELLNEYRNRIVNFHPAVLPSFPGRKAIDQALEQGALVLGNTAHFVDTGVDTGPMIMQSILPRARFDGYDSVLDLQLPMLAQIIRWLEEDRVVINGCTVVIRDARYQECSFVPNLEIRS